LSKKALDIETRADNLCLVRDLARGLIEMVYHQVGIQNPKKGSKTKKSEATGGLGNAEDGVVLLHHSITAKYKCQHPDHLITIVNDGTQTREELEKATGKDVVDITPEGTLERKKMLVQVPVDVRQNTRPSRAAKVLRGIIHDLTTFKNYQRIGVLTHKRLLDKKLAKTLGEPFASSVGKWGYFGSGESRGSNEWIDGSCDVLVVLGTPRFGPNLIGNHLLRLGNVQAGSLTADEAGWPTKKNNGVLDAWLGKTQSGRRVAIRSPHYKDHDWHRAYYDRVVAELLQSIGRARSLNDNGIDCIVVSTEFLGPNEDGIDGKNGVPISDWPYYPLNKKQWRLLDAMGDGSELCLTKWLAHQLDIKPRRLRKLLNELAAQGRVEKVGQRGGWRRLTETQQCNGPFVYEDYIPKRAVSNAELEQCEAEYGSDAGSDDNAPEVFMDEEVEHDYGDQHGE
jgi:hypothetical protein